MYNRSKYLNDKVKTQMYLYKIQQRIAYTINGTVYAIIQGRANIL